MFAVDFKLLPIGGMIDVGSNSTGFAYVIEVAKHMVLPVFILTLLGVGSLTRYFRTSMLEVVRQDYIRTARAKGLKEKTVIYKHALKMLFYRRLLYWHLNYRVYFQERLLLSKFLTGQVSVIFN